MDTTAKPTEPTILETILLLKKKIDKEKATNIKERFLQELSVMGEYYKLVENNTNQVEKLEQIEYDKKFDSDGKIKANVFFEHYKTTIKSSIDTPRIFLKEEEINAIKERTT
jgi:hypothetical protein